MRVKDRGKLMTLEMKGEGHGEERKVVTVS